jgi:hypothetical protein
MRSIYATGEKERYEIGTPIAMGGLITTQK